MSDRRLRHICHGHGPHRIVLINRQKCPRLLSKIGLKTRASRILEELERLNLMVTTRNALGIEGYEMRVTVITVCYNAAPEIERTMLSVINQTHANLEYVIIDGGSGDGTVSIIEKYGPKIATFVSEPDNGIYDAMNKGLRVSTGDLIIFMNAGDWFVSNYVVANVVLFLELEPGADVVYGGLEVRLVDGNIVDYFVPDTEAELEFLVKGSLPHQATFARRSAFARTKPFSSKYKVHADYEWFLKVAADPDLKIVRLPFIVASFVMGGRSSNLLAHEQERYDIQNSLPLFQRPDWLKRRIEIYQKFCIELKS